MELDLSTLSQGVRYKILTSLVVPRPIAWVTTLDESGRVNAAPYSFFNVMGNRPPVVAFGPGYRADGSPKDTRANLERSGEFVINLVDRAMASAMHQSAGAFPPDVSETEALGIATEPSTAVQVPRVAGCRVHLECRHHQTVEVMDNRIVLGIVEHIHVADGIFDPETFHVGADAFLGIGRLQGPGWYCDSADRFDLGPIPQPETKE